MEKQQQRRQQRRTMQLRAARTRLTNEPRGEARYESTFFSAATSGGERDVTQPPVRPLASAQLPARAGIRSGPEDKNTQQNTRRTVGLKNSSNCSRHRNGGASRQGPEADTQLVPVSDSQIWAGRRLATAVAASPTARYERTTERAGKIRRPKSRERRRLRVEISPRV